ncbi:hypothetical protein C1646_705813, partial [Rhizophagus diaphanus]
MWVESAGGSGSGSVSWKCGLRVLAGSVGCVWVCVCGVSLYFFSSFFFLRFIYSLSRYLGLFLLGPFLYVFLSYKFCIAGTLYYPIHKISINRFIIFFFLEHKLWWYFLVYKHI